MTKTVTANWTAKKCDRSVPKAVGEALAVKAVLAESGGHVVVNEVARVEVKAVLEPKA